MNKPSFANQELYHIYNRGVDKRIVFLDQEDILRFFQSMNEFNSINPIGSIYENSFRNQLGNRTPKLITESTNTEKLVEFIAYCLNPNHYHFIVKQISDNGVSKFMQKLGTGYSNFFNEKYDRSGSLFQGKFKARHINSNEYLLHLSAYVNLNDKVHKLSNNNQLGSPTPKLIVSKTSWDEYVTSFNDTTFCKKDMVLKQFTDGLDYKRFAENSLKSILERKDMLELTIEN